MATKYQATGVGKGYKATSVRNRLLELLETYSGEWLNIDQLEHEYSERFGRVKRETLRVTLQRMIRADLSGKVYVRRVARPWPTNQRLEILFRCDDEE